ncbi:MAG: hypothetical protein ACE367_16820 [Acidimicrobiales bacterium]
MIDDAAAAILVTTVVVGRQGGIEMAEGSDARSPAFEAAGDRRVELKAALSAVEIVAAGPAGAPGWHERLTAALIDLSKALDTHVEEVERPDGLLEELTEAAPRLVNHVDRLRDEHPVLQAQMAALIARADPIGDAVAPADDLRSEVLDALVAIARHRQRGADLVYEVHNVDIGGG